MENKPDDKKPLPPLKAALEAVQIQHEGRPMVLLRDQEGICEKSVAVSLSGFLIATLLDGQNTMDDVRNTLANNGKALISAKDIQNLIDQLDKSGLLETPELQKRREKILKDFAESPVRKPHHAKSGYPENTLELATFLGKFFKESKGPGKEFETKPAQDKPPLALISPHIDFYRGGPAYAWSYQALSQAPAPDVILALGVAHMSPNSPWIMTPKNFETPYGAVDFDPALYEEIKKTLWYEPREDEWVHRTEHSLEFQALWLKYLWKDKAPKWVPILCSSFERFCPDKAPSTVIHITETLDKMGGILKSYQDQGKTVMILSGIDLSHVGPRFGDNEKLGPELKTRLEKEDRDSLALAMKLEPDEFYLSVVKDNHWRKWCGLTSLYCTLRLVKSLGGTAPKPGDLLTYDQADDPMGGIVSFASAVFRA